MNTPGLIARLRTCFFRSKPLMTRLLEKEVLELALSAIRRAGVVDEFEMVDVRVIEGRLCWIICTAAKDAGWSVIVDDATGVAEEPQAWNGWTGDWSQTGNRPFGHFSR